MSKWIATAALLAVGACGSSDKTITAPPIEAKACGSGGTLQLSALTAATVACTAGTTVTLTGAGASYLVVPQYAVGATSNHVVSYSLGVVAGGASASLVASLGPTLDVVPGASRGAPRGFTPGARQRAFDAALMERTRQSVLSGKWRPTASRLTPEAPRRATIPAVGSVRQFEVLSSEKPVKFTAVGARLSYVGANILLYVDTLAPANGFTSDQLNGFGQLFDQTLYPIDTAAFGQPSDIDQNGRLIMLLSPIVNALSPSSGCDTQGFVGGFFTGVDLDGAGGANSNGGEIFYSLVPDPNGSVSCAHTVIDLLDETPATFLHELQHLINFSQHVVLRHGNPELGWLDEGLSIVAEELGSLYYENKFPPPSGRTKPEQLFPDSSEGFIGGALLDSYAYLLKTDTASITYHSDADDGFAWRGGDWLLMRWLGDVKGTSVYRALEQTTLTGTANIANAAGENFDTLFGDFSLAPYTDSLPGVPKSSIPVRNKFGYRNLRQMYNRLYQTTQTSGGSSLIPRPFPIVVRQLTGSIAASMVPGTMSFYRLDTTGQGTVTIDFGATPGVPITATLHPQLSIFRLQ